MDVTIFRDLGVYTHTAQRQEQNHCFDLTLTVPVKMIKIPNQRPSKPKSTQVNTKLKINKSRFKINKSQVKTNKSQVETDSSKVKTI